jgi:hypothetical protein
MTPFAGTIWRSRHSMLMRDEPERLEGFYDLLSAHHKHTTPK